MTKIVLDARELRTSSGRYVERLLYYLQQLDGDYKYTVLLKPTDFDSWQPTNPRFQKVICPHKEFSFDEQLGLKKQLEDLRPDLVHFAFAQQPVWYEGPAVTTFHDLTTIRFTNPDKNPIIFKFKQRVYRWVIRRAAKKSRQLIVPSQYVKDDLAAFTHVSDDKITVTYESADKITETAEPLKAVQGKRFIMYVGRPTPHKNLERLIEAFKLIQIQQPDLYLVLAGKLDANYRRIQQKAKNEQNTNIIFTDFITDGQLRWLYENTAAYVFPSLSEGFGLPGLEAMQYGAPVVSSNATCLPEIYGQAASYFDPLNIQDMATKINAVITNKALAEQLSANGTKQLKNYSWQRMAEQTLAVYQKALQEK
jgi:glycosyltransferase involved in cell wall biosynthesis